MNLYDVLIMIAAWFLLITGLARLNDITREQNTKRWWTRRMGLLGLIAAMGLRIGSYFGVYVPYWREIAEFLMYWGVGLVWLTTPGMPPWWKWVSRHDPTHPE